jgi:hypothetical protein
MEDMASWMYGWPRYSQSYHDEVDKFIIDAVNHAKTLPGTNGSAKIARTTWHFMMRK